MKVLTQSRHTINNGKKNECDVYCNIVEGFNPKDAGGTVRATSYMGYRQDGISQWQNCMQPSTMNLHFKRR